jgi:hypothetical protein
VSTTSTLWLDISLGLLAAGLVFGALLLLTWWDRRRQERAAAQLHVPQHRALDSAPVQVIRLPVAQIEERTEEMPVLVEPVVHVEVSETSTPLAEVFVPLTTVVDDGLPRALAEHVTDSASGDDRHLGRIDGALRGYHARLSGANATIDRWLREAGELPGRAEARRAAYPHCDDPSIEIPVSELAALVAAGRAGAR